MQKSFIVLFCVVWYILKLTAPRQVSNGTPGMQSRDTVPVIATQGPAVTTRAATGKKLLRLDPTGVVSRHFVGKKKESHHKVRSNVALEQRAMVQTFAT